MARIRDEKLALLSSYSVGAGRALHELRALGRYADLATVPAGELLQREGSRPRWSYLILDGAALVSAEETPIAVAGAGSWLLGAVGPATPSRLAGTAVAGQETQVLCFRPDDLVSAVAALPGLLGGDVGSGRG